LNRLYVFDLRHSAALPDATSDESAAKKEWRSRFLALRAAQADALVELARAAMKEKSGSLAFELVREAVHENPDHEQARKILGFVKHQGQWRTPGELRLMRLGKVYHEKFGWLPKAQVARYENGERFYSGRWMSAEQEAKLRTDIKTGWQIESEHYLLTTNDSLESGVAMTRQLERLYDIWQQVFIRYLASEADLAKAFQSRVSPLKGQQQYKVVYYRSRDEYNAALRPIQPRIEITLGLYLGNSQTAHFFAGADQQPGTIYHEATHQLFQESRPVVHDVGRKSNFWIVEAVACYMESLDEHDGYVTLGGFETGRLPAARHRLLVDGYDVPLAELTALGMDDLQAREDIARLYSQSAGQAMFFIHADGGKYRDALMQYLVAVYTGRATPGTLAQLTGQPYEALDQEYRKFMTNAPQQGANE
jgi:hypothetical protein